MAEPTSDPTTLELEAAAELPAELEARLEAHPYLEGVNVTAHGGQVLLVGATPRQVGAAEVLAGPAWRRWTFLAEPAELAPWVLEAERVARRLASQAGRGARGLALSAMATDLWKVRATAQALEYLGSIPAVED